MASILCSECNEKIHYHGVAEGIEYTLIDIKKWKNICNSKFDKNKKEYIQDGKYPKLYRSDTIENDFPDDILKFWKCPNCGCAMFFSSDKSVSKVFVKTDSVLMGSIQFEGLIFDDFLWQSFSENPIPNNGLGEISPSAYIRGDGHSYVISFEQDFTEHEYCYVEKI